MNYQKKEEYIKMQKFAFLYCGKEKFSCTFVLSKGNNDKQKAKALLTNYNQFLKRLTTNKRHNPTNFEL